MPACLCVSCLQMLLEANRGCQTTETGVTKGVNHQKWVLGTELGASGKSEPSLQPCNFIFLKC